MLGDILVISGFITKRCSFALLGIRSLSSAMIISTTATSPVILIALATIVLIIGCVIELCRRFSIFFVLMILGLGGSIMGWLFLACL